MLSLLPTPTTDVYPTGDGGCQLGGRDGGPFDQGFFLVANNPAIGRYLFGVQGQGKPSLDIYLPPSTYPLAQHGSNPITGIQFRSAVAGSPAVVAGVLYSPNDPTILAGTPFTGTVNPSGSITPPPTFVTYGRATGTFAFSNADTNDRIYAPTSDGVFQNAAFFPAVGGQVVLTAPATGHYQICVQLTSVSTAGQYGVGAVLNDVTPVLQVGSTVIAGDHGTGAPPTIDQFTLNQGDTIKFFGWANVSGPPTARLAISAIRLD